MGGRILRFFNVLPKLSADSVEGKPDIRTL